MRCDPRIIVLAVVLLCGCARNGGHPGNAPQNAAQPHRSTGAAQGEGKGELALAVNRPRDGDVSVEREAAARDVPRAGRDVDADEDADRAARGKKGHKPGALEAEEGEGERPDNPGEALEFRYRQRLSEDGHIPPNALMRAAADREAAMQGVGLFNGGISTATWSEIGPGNIGGRIRSILIQPANTNTMWLGSVGGGVWKTTNGGTSWATAGNFLPSLPVGSMAMDPTNSNVLYAGTGEGMGNSDALPGAGILKSTDGGANWSQITATIPINSDPTADDWGYVNRIAISPTNNQVMLAATRTGVFRTTDGGTNWSQVVSGQACYDADFHPTDGTKAVVGASSTTRARFSTDGGATWTTAGGITAGSAGTGGSRTELAYSKSNPNVVYAGVNAGNSSIFKSIDGGQNYTLASSNSGYLSGQGWYDNALAVDPTNEHTIYVGGLDLWRSTNDGVTLTKISDWTQAPNSAHADHHAIVFSPQYDGSTNKTCFFGNDGGIYKAVNVTTVTSTSGWTFLNNTLGITQFYGGAVNSRSGVVIGGTQDNGTLRYTGNANGWTAMFGGDGGFCAADQANTNYFYGEYVRCRIHRSSNAGVSSGFIYAGGSHPLADAVNSTANFISHFVIDPNNSNRILAGCANLWRTNVVRQTNPDWYVIKSSVGSNVSTVTVVPGHPELIWVGHNNGDVYTTTNGLAASPGWTKLDDNTPGLPGRFVQRIAVDPANTGRVYVAFSGYTTQNLWRSDNGGASWTVVTGPGTPGQPNNLPRAPVNSVVLHPVLPGWLYAGTDVGVWASTNSGASWSTSNDGPGNVDVEELFFNGQTKLIAATHGRGMFQATLDLSALDCNSNGTPDSAELSGHDCNSNGILDACEGRDCNTNATPDSCESDCNSNGVADVCERAAVTAADCNTNNTLDACETIVDCDRNGVPDACDLANPAQDCNTDHTVDACQLASGDCDGNGTLDVCELSGRDCNSNGSVDVCDLAGAVVASDACSAAPRIVPGVVYSGSTVGATSDGADNCTGAGPDVWFLYVPASAGSATVSLCASQFDTVLSVHSACPGGVGNMLACDDDFCGGGAGSQVTLSVAAGTSYYLRIAGSGGVSGSYSLMITGPTVVTTGDCNGDGTLDVCQLFGHDCNTNGTFDTCELNGSTDANANGVLDVCEGCATCPGDVNGDGQVDGRDAAGFVSCYLAGPAITGGCGCADLNADAMLTAADVSAFVNKLLTKPTPACP